LQNLATMTGAEIRSLIRRQKITGSTAGMAEGYTQANLVILKKEYAFDFLLFAQRNPKSCPILDVVEPGSYTPKLIARHADIRTDLPKYRIYINGSFESEVNDITHLYEDDMVGFLIGCSFTFETPLLRAGIPVRHIEEKRNVPMYRTNIPCQSAGIFQGPVVVSMRPMTSEQAIRAVQITTKFPNVHGAPIHIGDPTEIGIQDIYSPDYGEIVTIKDHEVPVFWACGVTPQAVVMESQPSLMITHAPGCMFVSDVYEEALSIL